MKTSKLTHEARALMHAGQPTGYTRSAELTGLAVGRFHTTGGVPVHWMAPADPLKLGRPTMDDGQHGPRFMGKKPVLP